VRDERVGRATTAPLRLYAPAPSLLLWTSRGAACRSAKTQVRNNPCRCPLSAHPSTFVEVSGWLKREERLAPRGALFFVLFSANLPPARSG
jgi:hypothetical protein